PAREHALRLRAPVSGPRLLWRTGLGALAVGSALALGLTDWSPGPRRVLRVCADPNNLPFSNDRLEGLENRLASLIADDLGRALEWVWWAQRRGFLRNTLNAGACDVVMGVPASMEMLL